MKEVLFITCLTPRQYLSPLRKALFELYKEALTNQDNNSWTALLIGEEEKTEGNFIYFKAAAITKEDKLLEVYNHLLQLEKKPKYIIRIDDDDLISPTKVSEILSSSTDYDCYVDKYQAMYNLVNGKTLFNSYNWYPSTLVMKYEDAMLGNGGPDSKPLFCCDHSIIYHRFYKNKNVKFFRKKDPLYLRIISPTSLSIKGNVQSYDEKTYSLFVNGFGRWSYNTVNNFELPITKLNTISKQLFDSNIPTTNFTIHNMRGLINHYLGKILK